MDDLTRKLALEYDLSALRKAAEDFHRPIDREKYRAMTGHFQALVDKQEGAFLRDYTKRLTMAGRTIAKEKGLNFDKTIKAKDALSKRQTKALKRLAHSAVQSDHLRRVTTIRQNEATELRRLVDTVCDRENARNAQKQTIKLITDGRAQDPSLLLRQSP